MKLIASINQLKKKKIAKEISNKISDFENIGDKTSKEIYLELCYCLLTANFNAKKSVEIQKNIGIGFTNFSLES